MKKTLLSLAAFSFFAFAQAPIIQDYNTLIIGNVGTDFTGATAGHGSQFTLATNGWLQLQVSMLEMTTSKLSLEMLFTEMFANHGARRQ